MGHRVNDCRFHSEHCIIWNPHSNSINIRIWGVVGMKYKNAEEVLPEYLLLEIRKYIGGGLVYFPKLERRKSWGSLSGIRDHLEERNMKIKRDYKNGFSLSKLKKKYFLSQSSLYRIIKD